MTSTLWSFQKQVCGTPVGDKAAIMAGQSKFDENIGFMRMASLGHWKAPGDASLHGLIGHTHGEHPGF